MKAVALICIVSLSLCLSQPTTDQPGVHPAQGASDLKPGNQAASTTNQTQTTKLNGTENATATNKTSAENATPQGLSSSTPKPVNETASAKNQTSTNVLPATTNASVNTTDGKAANTTEHTKSEGASSSPATPAKESSPVKNSTTTGATTLKPEIPKGTTDKTPVEVKSNFSGTSFVGGIILTLGLLAIGFIGFKYYKNRTESNYHTL